MPPQEWFIHVVLPHSEKTGLHGLRSLLAFGRDKGAAG